MPPKYDIPKDKVVRTLNLKKADGSFVTYPLGARGEFVLLKEGVDLETKLDSIIVEIDKGSILVPIEVKKESWVSQGENGTYTQTVESEQISDRNGLLVGLMKQDATAQEEAEYTKNFAILSHGYIETGNGEVIFTAYSQPTSDITVGIVLGSMPIPADIPLWKLDADETHILPDDETKIVQGGGEPQEGKDLVTIEYLQKNIFKLRDEDTLLFSFINTAYHSSLKPNVLTLVPELFEIDEAGQKLIVKNGYKE